MADHLDENLKKLLRRAPPPGAPPREAADRVFAQVCSRLRNEERKPRARRWVRLAALAASLLLALAVWRFSSPPAKRVAQRSGRVATTAVPPVPDRATTEPAPSSGSQAAKQAEVRWVTPAEGTSEKVVLKDGSHLTVSGGSRAKITSWPDRKRPLVELEKGEVACLTAKGSGAFKVRTAVGEAAALGTEYVVRLTEDPDREREGGTEMSRAPLKVLIMTVAVLEGQVLVTGPDGFRQVAVAGENVAVAKRTGPADSFRSGQLVPRLADGRVGEPMEVRRHEVTVTIRDQIALVEVDQVFYNPSPERLEGIFHFPLPNGAAICRLAMYVGDNLMEGEIAEAARARRTFEALKVQRIDPALLEWAGGNNFKMRVFPIEPKSEKRVLISYYQVLPVENDRLLFSYPLASDALQTNPVGKVSVKAVYDSQSEILSAKTPGYAARIEQDAGRVEVQYTAEKVRHEKNFELEVKLSPGRPELVALPFWHTKDAEGYFLAIFSPKLEAFASQKEIGSRFVFVLDKSGGLGPRHLSLAVKTVTTALGMLRKGDRFGIVAYDAFAQSFRPALVPNTPENIAAATDWLNNFRAVGASDLSAAWQAAAGLAGDEPAQVVYVGAGLSSLTSTKSGKLLQEAEAAFAKSLVRLHCLPLGNIQDLDFLGELARKYSGALRVINSADDLYDSVAELMQDYGAPLYTGVKVAFEGVEAAEVYPKDLPNVASGRQLFVFGKYLNQGRATVKLTAGYKDQPYSKEFAVNLGASAVNTCIPPLWATRKIEHLQRELTFAEGESAQNMTRTVVETSKRYTVMSQYTSFLVLESPEDYLRYGIERRVREFGPYAGQGGIPAAEQMQQMQAQTGGHLASRRGGPGGGGGKDPAEPFSGETTIDQAGWDDRAKVEPSVDLGKKVDVGLPKPGKELAAGAPEAPHPAKQAAARIPPPPPGYKYNARRVLADPDLRVSGWFVQTGAPDKCDADFETDALAWGRSDIFPAFEAAPADPQANWPRGWRHSDAAPLEVLRNVAGRIKNLSCKVVTFRLEKNGKEVQDGREWLVVLDAAANRFLSHRLGDDAKDVCDGKRLVRFFPLLKYAAARSATVHDLRNLAANLPGCLIPWAEKLDRDGLVSIENQGPEGVILRVTSRGNDRSYIRLFLETEKGPVTKIEVYQSVQRGKERVSQLRQAVTCGDFQDLGGVKVPTTFRICNLPGGMEALPAPFDPANLKALEDLAAKLRAEGGGERAAEIEKRIKQAQAGLQVVKLADLKINAELPAETFKIEMPKDWSVRNLDVTPLPGDRRAVSTPINPSQNEWGRQPWGGRGWRE